MCATSLSVTNLGAMHLMKPQLAPNSHKVMAKCQKDGQRASPLHPRCQCHHILPRALKHESHSNQIQGHPLQKDCERRSAQASDNSRKPPGKPEIHAVADPDQSDRKDLQKTNCNCQERHPAQPLSHPTSLPKETGTTIGGKVKIKRASLDLFLLFAYRFTNRFGRLAPAFSPSQNG